MNFKSSEKIFNDLNRDNLEAVTSVQREVDKKIALLVAEEELRRQRERERAIRLEQIKNESFQKKLEKIRTELEYQEFMRQMKIREMMLLEVEAENMDAEERMLDEIKLSTIESLTDQHEVKTIDTISFEDDQFDDMLEMRKEHLMEMLRSKKANIRHKEDELTRIINLADTDEY